MNTKNLRIDELDRIVGVDDARAELGNISRATLSRISALQRIQLSPGRIGYRMGDLRDYLRRGGLPDQSSGSSNCIICYAGMTLQASTFEGLKPGIRTVLVTLAPGQKEAADARGETTICLPTVSYWGRDLTIIDRDGIAADHLIRIVPNDGQLIAGKADCKVLSARGAVRLHPVLLGSPDQNDEWWVA